MALEVLPLLGMICLVLPQYDLGIMAGNQILTCSKMPDLYCIVGAKNIGIEKAGVSVEMGYWLVDKDFHLVAQEPLLEPSPQLTARTEVVWKFPMDRLKV